MNRNPKHVRREVLQYHQNIVDGLKQEETNVVSFEKGAIDQKASINGQTPSTDVKNDFRGSTKRVADKETASKKGVLFAYCPTYELSQDVTCKLTTSNNDANNGCIAENQLTSQLTHMESTLSGLNCKDSILEDIKKSVKSRARQMLAEAEKLQLQVYTLERENRNLKQKVKMLYNAVKEIRSQLNKEPSRVLMSRTVQTEPQVHATDVRTVGLVPSGKPLPITVESLSTTSHKSFSSVSKTRQISVSPQRNVPHILTTANKKDPHEQLSLASTNCHSFFPSKVCQLSPEYSAKGPPLTKIREDNSTKSSHHQSFPSSLLNDCCRQSTPDGEGIASCKRKVYAMETRPCVGNSNCKTQTKILLPAVSASHLRKRETVDYISKEKKSLGILLDDSESLPIFSVSSPLDTPVRLPSQVTKADHSAPITSRCPPIMSTSMTGRRQSAEPRKGILMISETAGIGPKATTHIRHPMKYISTQTLQLSEKRIPNERTEERQLNLNGPSVKTIHVDNDSISILNKQKMRNYKTLEKTNVSNSETRFGGVSPKQGEMLPHRHSGALEDGHFVSLAKMYHDEEDRQQYKPSPVMIPHVINQQRYQPYPTSCWDTCPVTLMPIRTNTYDVHRMHHRTLPRANGSPSLEEHLDPAKHLSRKQYSEFIRIEGMHKNISPKCSCSPEPALLQKGFDPYVLLNSKLNSCSTDLLHPAKLNLLLSQISHLPTTSDFLKNESSSTQPTINRISSPSNYHRTSKNGLILRNTRSQTNCYAKPQLQMSPFCHVYVNEQRKSEQVEAASAGDSINWNPMLNSVMKKENGSCQQHIFQTGSMKRQHEDENDPRQRKNPRPSSTEVNKGDNHLLQHQKTRRLIFHHQKFTSSQQGPQAFIKSDRTM